VPDTPDPAVDEVPAQPAANQPVADRLQGEWPEGAGPALAVEQPDAADGRFELLDLAGHGAVQTSVVAGGVREEGEQDLVH
jgi:hypothetical protein